MMRLALGAKWRGLTKPRYLPDGASAAWASEGLSNPAKAIEPIPQVERFRNERREAWVFKSSYRFIGHSLARLNRLAGELARRVLVRNLRVDQRDAAGSPPAKRSITSVSFW